MMGTIEMAEAPQVKRFVTDPRNLPSNFPTQGHSAEFWEALGRTVATLGFLEETLGRAIFAFQATRKIPQDRLEEEFEKWLPALEKALTDTLGGKINAYDKAVRANDDATIENLDDLLEDLRELAAYRNVLCHGSWKFADDQGRSIPRFVDKKNRVFQTPIDVQLLRQVQQQAVKLSCEVINTVTHMGYQFPGSGGPGGPIIKPHQADASE